MTKNKSEFSHLPDFIEEDDEAQVSSLDQSLGQQGPEDDYIPQHDGSWGGDPVMDAENLIEDGVAEGAYKQPMKEYITPAAHYVERFGQMHAGDAPYHPYTIAVGMNAVRDFFISSGLSETESTMMAQSAFDIHVKSGKLLDPNRAKLATELSKQGTHIDDWAARREALAKERLVKMDEDGALGEHPANLDFDALEQSIPEPKVSGKGFAGPRIEDSLIDSEVMAPP